MAPLIRSPSTFFFPFRVPPIEISNIQRHDHVCNPSPRYMCKSRSCTMACTIPTQEQHLPPSCRCPCYHRAQHRSFFVFMLFTRLATTVAVLVTLSLSTTLAFGAINPLLPSAIRGHNHLSRSSNSNMGSSQSLLQQSWGSGAVANGDKNSVVQLSATQNSNGINGGHNSCEYAISAYTPPSHPIKPLAHYIFLVHGWLGNDFISKHNFSSERWSSW